MKAKELIKDYWYKIIDDDVIYYFKFECIKNYCINSYNLYLSYINYNTYNIVNTQICTLDWFERVDIKVEKIDISEIINFLPDTNSDKINFLRKQRIKNLLNES